MHTLRFLVSLNQYEMAPAPRMVIYTKDIQCIIGRSERSARYLMAELRKALGRSKHQYVSVQEFCTYTGLPYQEVMQYIKD